MDILIKQARLMEGELKDIAIKDGQIQDIGENLSYPAQQVIEAQGRLTIPSFVDVHTHLEKAMVGVESGVNSLEDAILAFGSRYSSLTKEDIQTRARQVLELAIENGTGTIRSHVTVVPEIGLIALEALLELKEKAKRVIDLQLVAMPAGVKYELDRKTLDLLEEAARLGVEALGGAPHLALNPFEAIDKTLDLAEKYDLAIDFHVDETDEPDVRTLEYLADQVLKRGFKGRVVAGHCCALAAVSDEVANRVIAKVKEAGISVVTLPSCNLYLMGRKDKQPIRRGVTRVRELLKAGVNVAYASDNIRDPFRPFGNADMLEEALITAQVVQMGLPQELETVLRMGTYNAAQAAGLGKLYGLHPGAQADVVILDARDPAEAIITQATKLYVLKRGRVVAKNKKQVEIYLPW
ncbi:cytosine deaminase [Thermanaeromonas toyohensis ToBE]|uniref:Cytosine deaminase n=1 Tax=Thermanaeromonas toyohensis ToBE TaxID=698762 RepID=A0A1W1VFB1_9FIRM|nr:amidohydrolase family protein [Thermanaeromonas toyohensis]SMB92042.1 cytosine deaminase [Thermanaeromonas toyohensis ToBE]